MTCLLGRLIDKAKGISHRSRLPDRLRIRVKKSRNRTVINTTCRLISEKEAFSIPSEGIRTEVLMSFLQVEWFPLYPERISLCKMNCLLAKTWLVLVRRVEAQAMGVENGIKLRAGRNVTGYAQLEVLSHSWP